MFGLFVSPTGKGKAIRYGSNRQLGRYRAEDGSYRVDTTMVFAIPCTELIMCGQGYERQIKEGALKRCTAADYAVYLEREEQARKASIAAAAEAVAKAGQTEIAAAQQHDDDQE